MASLQHMQRLQVQLPEGLADRLRKTAEAEGTSQAEIVRRALESYLRRPVQAHEATVRARALEVVGAFSSGLSDVAEMHDRYLAEDADEHRYLAEGAAADRETRDDG